MSLTTFRRVGLSLKETATMPKKAQELPKIMDLPSKARTTRPDEIPHWKVWRWALRNPGLPWKKSQSGADSDGES